MGVDSVQAPGTLKLAGGTLTLANASNVARLDQSAGTITGAGELVVASGTWSGGTMAGTGTTRVTGTLTHTQNTSLDGTRVLAIEGTLEMAAAGRYINRSGTPLIRNTGTIKRTVAGTVELYPAVENDGLIDGVELEGGGTRLQRRLHRDAASIPGPSSSQTASTLNDVTFDGGTVNVTGTVTASGAMSAGAVGGAGTLARQRPVHVVGRLDGRHGHHARDLHAHAHGQHLAHRHARAGRSRARWRWRPTGATSIAPARPVVRNTGTIKRTAAGTVELYAALDNDGRVEGVELEGGGERLDRRVRRRAVPLRDVRARPTARR